MHSPCASVHSQCASMHGPCAGMHSLCAGVHSQCVGMHSQCASMHGPCAGLKLPGFAPLCLLPNFSLLTLSFFPISFDHSSTPRRFDGTSLHSVNIRGKKKLPTG